MKLINVTTAAAAFLVCGAANANPAMGQQRNPLTRMDGLVMSAFAGGAAYTDLQRSHARVDLLLAAGAPASTEFTRRLSPQTSPAVAFAAAYWFSQRLGARGHFGIAPSRFEVTVSEREAALLPADSQLAGPPHFARVTILTGDLQLLIRAPFTPRGRVAPYGFIGAGVLRYVAGTSEPLPPEAEAAFAAKGRPTMASAVFGGGALIPLQRRSLALTFELSDHIARTPVERTPSATLTDGNAIRVVTSELNEQDREGRVRTTNHVRLLVGISLLIR